MRLLKIALTAGLSCALMATHADAQQLKQPNSIQRTAYSYYQPQAEGQASPSDAPLAPSAAGVAPQASASVGDLSACNSCGTCDTCCVVDEPWRLTNRTLMGFQVRGWIDAGATANADDPNSNYNGVQTFNDRNEGQLNQLYAILERGIVTSCCDPWDVGGRIDLLFGSDYIFTQAQGLELHDDGTQHWNGRPQYGLALPQAYGEIGYYDARLKVGHFYTPLGFEGVQAPNNFFYSHAYTMQYGEPFTHTGALLSYSRGDNWDFNSGIVNGWDRFDGESDRASYVGSTTYTPDHQQYSITLGSIYGQEFNDIGRFSDRTLYSLVFNYNVTDNLNYVLQHDHGWQENFFQNGLDAEWYGINQYLFYDINECWSAGARMEWFRDDDGTRVTGVRPGNPINGSYAGDFYNVTLGLNWKPTANFRLRPEVRWDWYDGPTSLTGGTAPLPFDDGNEDEQFTAAFDAILLW